MKFHNLLEEVLGQKSKIKVLRVLFNTKMEMTGRQIAEFSGLNHRTCQLSLKELEKEGIVSLRRAGKSNLFRLKEENYFVKNILHILFKEEKALFQLLVNKILRGTWKKDNNVISIILFGSFAQEREVADSDIDLFILCQKNTDKNKIGKRFDLLNQELIKSFGNVVSPYILSLEEVKRRYKKNDKLIREIIKSGKIIYGKSLDEVISFGGKKV